MMRLIVTSILLVALVVGGCGPTTKPKDEVRAHHKMGQSYLARKEYSKALNELLKAEKLAPDNAAIQANLAEAYYGKRAYELSEKHFKESLRLDPDNPNVENNLAALYLDMQRWDDAAQLFRKVSGNLLFPYRVRSLTGLGLAYQRDGEYIKAILALNEALDSAPGNTGILALQAQTYMWMEKYDLASKQLQKVMKLAPEFSAARLMLGECYLYLEDNTAAAEQFREVANREDGTERGDKAREYLKMLQDPS
ncbi:tetratricopeptide repeat protein [uncultured Desulfuromonas sp.]|uniref:tetratricopeptide repeat protein n=1 Tax=uncultured Desulfuromonas sp. TaxID=181013 RepID=UPI002AAA7168|nr:tetratricopeptide repeat protein [uncultured Desulfuromonas sp.]